MNILSIFILSLLLSASAIAGDWSCTKCQFAKDSYGEHTQAHFYLYYKGAFHSKKEFTSAGECIWDQDMNGKCIANPSHDFGCGPLKCAGNTCFWDRTFGGYQYTRFWYDTKGRALEEYNVFCKR